MKDKQTTVSYIVFTIAIAVLLFGGAYFIPWQSVHWGKIEWKPTATITTNGTAKTEKKSQAANFSAGASSVNDNKDLAIAEVNKKMQVIIDAVKTFGIPPGDIKTQNINVYQAEETYYENGRQKARPGQWRISNSVEIKLRNVDKASEFTELLANHGATNIYGPNFSFDDTQTAETELLDKAIANAKEKATLITKSTGRTLGPIISISEGTPMISFNGARMEVGLGGGGGPVEPGSGTVQKTITVTYELK